MRRRTLLAGGLGVAAGLAGCSRFGGGGGAAGGGSDGGALNMVWWGDADRAAVTEEALELFRGSSGVQVTTEFQSGSAYDDKLAVRFAGGNPPDVLAMRREALRDFSDRGSLLELPVGDGLDASGVPESVLNAGKVGGAQFGVPFGVASVAWVVNTELYEAQGVEVPDLETWSWDDLTAAAAAVTEASGGEVYGADYPLDDILTLGVWMRQRGEDLWTPDGGLGFTEDSIAEWFQTWVELRDAGAVPAGGAIEELGAAAEQSALGRGLVAGGSMPSNSYASFNAATGGALVMGFFPGETQGERRGHQIIPGGHWSITSASASPEAAVQLVDFLLNDIAANQAMGATRGAPPSTPVAQEVASTLSPDDQLSVDYLTALGELPLVDPIPDPLGSSEFLDALGVASEQVQFGQATPQAAAAEFFATAQSIIGAA